MKHFVYGIKNKITNKYYIGITNNTKTRFKKHIYTLNTNNHHSRKLQNSFNKYGIDNFEFEILLESNCEREEILNHEKEFISKYNSYHNGYNMNLGGLENNGFQSMFTEEIVKIICTVKERDSKSGGLLAEIFNTSRTSISRIFKGETQLDYFLKFKELSKEEKDYIYNEFVKNTSYDYKKCNNNKERILNKEEVFKILSFYKKYNKKEMLSKYFNCSQHLINQIIKNEIYRDYISEFKESMIDEILIGWEDKPSIYNNFNRKLSNEIIFEILRDIDKKIPRKEICEKFDLSTSTVDRLKKGTIYKDVIENYKSQNASTYSDVC